MHRVRTVFALAQLPCAAAVVGAQGNPTTDQSGTPVVKDAQWSIRWGATA